MASITQMDPMAPTRVVNETAQPIVTVASWLLAAGVIFWAYRVGRKENTWLPVAAMLAIAIAVINEPLFDKAFHLYFYDGGKQWTWLDTYGFPQPNWTMSAYIILYGIPVVQLLKKMKAGELTRQWLYKYYVITAVGIGAFESIAIYIGTYTYFGDHPFQPGKYPLWLGVMEGAHATVFATMIALLAPVLSRGWKPLLTLPLFLISFCSVMFGAGFLGLAVINADPVPTVVAYLGVIASMGLATVMVWFVSLGLRSEKPTSGAVPAFLRAAADRLSGPSPLDSPVPADVTDRAPAPVRERELAPSGD